nr:oxalate:formate antiporter [Hymenolepis microstoma]
MFGFGIGAAYSVLYAVSTAWFLDNRSLVVGIIASGLGLGALVFVPLQTYIINPNNVDDLFSPQVTERVPLAFLVLGGLILCLQIIGFALLREKERDLDIHIEPSIMASQDFADLKEEMKDPHRNYSTLEALRTIDFYLAFFINFFNSASVGLISCTVKWFLDNRSLVVGIIASGLGLGALVFVPLQTYIINPNNVDDLFSPQVTERVPLAFLVLGGLILCLQIIGFALLREKERDLDIHIEPSIMASQDFADLKEEMKDPHRNYSTLEALRTIDFYLAFFINFFNSASVGLISCTVKVYGIDAGFDKLFMATILTCCAIFNCLGRITWGYFGDRFSFKGPMTVLQIEWALLWFTYPYVTMPTGITGKALFTIWNFLLYSCIAGNFVLIPNLATRVFGPKNMPTIFGLIFAAMAPSNLILSVIFSNFDIRSYWKEIYSIGGFFAIIGLVLLIFVRDPNVRCVPCFTPAMRVCDCLRIPDKEKVILEQLKGALNGGTFKEDFAT